MTPTVALTTLQTAAPHGAAVSASPQVVHDALDSVVVHSSVPDPLIPYVQFLFQQPGWLLGLEFLVAGAVGAGTLWYMWTRRLWMMGWFRGTSRGAQAAFVGANVMVVLVALSAGMYGHNYAMHDNDFCKGCHIFVPSGQAWVRPDTGNYLQVNALEGKHDTLSCHSCHPFEITAQTKEMFFWIADRPDQVPPHGRVPQAVCERCHVQGEAKESWQRIASTPGHSIHLAEDSVKTGGKIQCLTCHARSAHRFEARDSTCAMSGCHVTNDIRLGKMAAQTNMHCTLCHQFAADQPAAVSTDSAKRLLIPGGTQCLACHGMQQLTAAFDFSNDPHKAKCGTCHNPHNQTRPLDADSTCASCHTKWREVAFHTGAIHRGTVRPSACTQCHQPHSARVDASDCTGCHTEMRKARGGHRALLPPLPFDTNAAMRTSAVPVPPPPQQPHGKGDAPVADDPPWRSDSFAHVRHQRLPCLTCHDPRSQQKLTFEPGRGCQICHHQAPERNACATCHTPEEIAARPPVVTVTVSVKDRPPLPRPVTFDHGAHRSQTCSTCHTTPVTLAPVAEVVGCTSCHAQHGAGSANCATCHTTAPDSHAHAPPADAHRACAACHAAALVATLAPTRVLCLTCHVAQRDHQPGGECTTCHLGADPATYRSRIGAGAGR